MRHPRRSGGWGRAVEPRRGDNRSGSGGGGGGGGGGPGHEQEEDYRYEVLTAEQILQHMVECIREVNEVIQVRVAAARAWPDRIVKRIGAARGAPRDAPGPGAQPRRVPAGPVSPSASAGDRECRERTFAGWPGVGRCAGGGAFQILLWRRPPAA